MQNTVTPTHCPYCALQCGMNLTPAPDGTGVEVSERADFPVNRGALCGKGRTAPAVLSSAVRLTSPLVRSAGGELVPASWEEALDRIAGELGRTRARYGADAVGVFGGGGLTNEKAYSLGKFARVVLGTSQIDYNGRFCMSSAAAAGTRAFGLDRGLPFPLEDIPRTGCVILVGSNPAETMPPSLRYFTELKENGGTLIVVDPRRTKTAEQADLHLAPRPGTDLALALGLLHLVVAEGRTDEEYVRERTVGWEETRASAMAHWPEYVERITGVSVPQLREAVRLFCAPGSAMVLTARGPEQQAKGTDTVSAWINLALATGRPGTPLSGYGCLTGQGNGQGGREHGQKADQLPGYRKLTDPAARAHVAGVWGVDPDTLPGPGRSAYELLDALGTDIRSLLLMGSNPVVSAPRAAHIEERIRSLDFLAVCDVVLSETAALADVVLPVTQWAEETGTTTNLEGRVLLRRRAVVPPEGVRSDLEVMHGLAARLGGERNLEKGFPTDPEEVFDELRRASAGGPADYSGITYRRLAEENGVFWPCPARADEPGATTGAATETAPADGTGATTGPGTEIPAATETGADTPVRPRPGTGADDTGGAGAAPRAASSRPAPAHTPSTGTAPADETGATTGHGTGTAGAGAGARVHPGTPRLFLERFATEDGRARFVPVSYRAIAEEPDDEYPVLLTTGRVVAQYQSGAQTRRVDELNAAAPGPFVELHPRLAERLGAAEGDPVAVVSRRGRAVAPARITTAIRADTVFMPFHWAGEGRANTLTNPALDPTSRMPEFKACAVRVEAVQPTPTALQAAPTAAYSAPSSP
ncbi:MULTISPECIES: molybdopterin oxidoreductase family protein [unclassified Streptomyces]|uniref:molybdopterin oxidoreductase family protein n=1 Tax=unclassified Streptomyces TaxID=2593676 RepID=UPI000F6C2427|nr:MULTISPECIES: molybdopterin oxidoreductase family protein [unclassified Streptomyces]AZM62445.1 nitrite reductase [Streptomyces sp. WAC 01438]RSM93528.1 nitrite reductase [Streptomyces sp. WAC 01420]